MLSMFIKESTSKTYNLALLLDVSMNDSPSHVTALIRGISRQSRLKYLNR